MTERNDGRKEKERVNAQTTVSLRKLLFGQKGKELAETQLPVIRYAVMLRGNPRNHKEGTTVTGKYRDIGGSGHGRAADRAAETAF